MSRRLIAEEMRAVREQMVRLRSGGGQADGDDIERALRENHHAIGMLLEDLAHGNFAAFREGIGLVRESLAIVAHHHHGG